MYLLQSILSRMIKFGTLKIACHLAAPRRAGGPEHQAGQRLHFGRLRSRRSTDVRPQPSGAPASQGLSARTEDF